MLPDLVQQVLPRHQERAAEDSGGRLFVLIRQGVGIDQTMRQLMRQREPAAFKRELVVHHDHRQVLALAVWALNQARQPGPPFRQRYGQDLQPFSSSSSVMLGIGSRPSVQVART